MTNIYPFPKKEPIPSIPCGKPVDLVVLSIKTNAMRTKMLTTGQAVTLRKPRYEIEGEIITVVPSKVWNFKNTTYMTGDVTGRRLDVEALNLVPLKMEDLGMWSPEEHKSLITEDDAYEKYYRPIMEFGQRPQFEMEQVIPNFKPEDFDGDPMLKAAEAYQFGDHKKAYSIISDVISEDLRCLDAHAHLGNWCFDGESKYDVKNALQHYETGMRIGELSLEDDFKGVLQWGFIDNRPYLRCMHGYGLCLWRLGREREAFKVFERMLWFNPRDNQGVRELLKDIDDGEEWNT